MDPDELRKMCDSIFSHTPKENQLQTINSYYGGKDTIFVALTGYRKSLIYQMAPFLYDKRHESYTKPHNSVLYNRSVPSFIITITTTHTYMYTPLIHSKTKKDKKQSVVVVDLLTTTLHSGHVLF